MIFGNIDFSSNRISNSEILWISVDLIGLVDIFIYHLVLINVLSILVTSGLISNWHVLLRCLMFLWQLSIVYALSANAFLIELYILVKKKKLGSKLVFLLLHLHFFFFLVSSAFHPSRWKASQGRLACWPTRHWKDYVSESYSRGSWCSFLLVQR